MSNSNLRRVEGFQWIGGVCAGIAYYLKVQTWLIRMVWVLVTLLGDYNIGISIVVYLLLWIFMPVWEDTPKDYQKICE